MVVMLIVDGDVVGGGGGGGDDGNYGDGNAHVCGDTNLYVSKWLSE